MKDKKVLIIVGIVILAIIGGVIFFVSSRTQSEEMEDVITEEVATREVTPEEIGLTLEPAATNNSIVMTITKLDGISSLEYELSYDAEVKENGETLTIPRGAVGSAIEVEPGESEITRKIDLGTCSANVCKFDTVVSDITFKIRINFENGEIGSLETTVPNPQAEE